MEILTQEEIEQVLAAIAAGEYDSFLTPLDGGNSSENAAVPEEDLTNVSVKTTASSNQ